jgi:hypothetical protein
MAGHHLATAHPTKRLRLGKEVGPRLHCQQLVAKGQHKIPQLHWCSALSSTPNTSPWQRQGDKTTPRQHANSTQAYSTQAGGGASGSGRLALRPVVRKAGVLPRPARILHGREDHHLTAQPHRTSGSALRVGAWGADTTSHHHNVCSLSPTQPGGDCCMHAKYTCPPHLNSPCDGIFSCNPPLSHTALLWLFPDCTSSTRMRRQVCWCATCHLTPP